MTDPVPDSRPPTRWLWVALIVLLAVAAVIVFLNPGGDAEDAAETDASTTTAEERLETDLGSEPVAE